jgi:hypothetical protein
MFRFLTPSDCQNNAHSNECGSTSFGYSVFGIVMDNFNILTGNFKFERDNFSIAKDNFKIETDNLRIANDSFFRYLIKS